MKPYLALFRSGPSSLHPHAIARLEAQNFDYALSWFGDEPPKVAHGAVFVHMQKGAKWPGLKETLAAHGDLISRYRYVWLPDDDLLAVPEDISRMFAICDELQLELAQPALTPDSYFTHLVTMQHRAFQLRFTNFVEIMAPVLSAAMLTKIYPTLDGRISGYGLDALWARFSRLGKVAIIDDTPVKHTRPVGGPNYAFSKKAGLAPAHEDWLVSASHFIDVPADWQVVYAGLLQSGDPICIGHTREEIDTMLRALLKVSALQLTRYLSNQLSYWAGGDNGRPRYPRALLRLVLDRELQHVGIRFPKPAEPVEPTPPEDERATYATAGAVRATPAFEASTI
jgi:hypothetical protein